MTLFAYNNILIDFYMKNIFYRLINNLISDNLITDNLIIIFFKKIYRNLYLYFSRNICRNFDYTHTHTHVRAHAYVYVCVYRTFYGLCVFATNL